MLSNYFTLLHCATVLSERYKGSVVAEIYSQEKNTLCIVFYTPEPHTLKISCQPRENFLYARAGTIRTNKNTIDLFPTLIHERLVSSYVGVNDRIVYLALSHSLYLLVEMFGSKANVLLCNAEGKILDAFLNKKKLLGKQRVLQLSEKPILPNDIVPEKEIFISSLQNGKDQSASGVLKKLVPKLGPILTAEIIYRVGIEHTAALNTLTEREYTRLYHQTGEILQEVLHPSKTLQPIIYLDHQQPKLFSLIPLQQYHHYQQEVFDDIFTAIQKFVSVEKASASFTQQKNLVGTWLEKEYEKASRTITAIESDIKESSRAELYELTAKLILANLHALKKGMKSAELENSFANNETIAIKLDPALSPTDNAERYFEKAKKSKTAAEESQQRLATLQQRSVKLFELKERFNQINDSISLKKFLELHDQSLHQLGYMTKKEADNLPPFKIFTVNGGFTVYAGKSSENNDLLTMKFAKPNDLWFHVRGSSGSHVVLKTGSADGNPSKKAIAQAASIAAYYSKMKNAKSVPIAMTEKKYVKKPRGASAGSVVIEREKVIFVEPELPEEGK